MLTAAVYRMPESVIEYFESGIPEAQYHGKLCERLGLNQEVTEATFSDLIQNVRPGSNGERLTARQNGTRAKWNGQTSNRRVATDWTFSLEKDKSVYLAKTKDPVFEGLVRQAFKEELDAMQAEVQTRVRKNGADHNRQTGEALFVSFVERTSRPVNGVPWPHYHIHAVMPNFTWDATEERFKAAELGKLFAGKKAHQESFHRRVNQLLIGAGYGFRQVGKDLQLMIFNADQLRPFSARTKQIEETGRHKREPKEAIVIEGSALEEHWRQQLGDKKWDSVTVDSAKGTPYPNHCLQRPDGTWYFATPTQIIDARHQSTREPAAHSSPSAMRWVQSMAPAREPSRVR
jgi:conjugative relaxase-like TrwC/TraI family protein